MFEDFEPFTVVTQQSPEVSAHGLRSKPAGAAGLPPLLLLHGFPQSRHIWHLVAPRLTAQYDVIIPDLRGYGASSKPAGVASYAKSAMARDCIALVDQLVGADTPFFVCAHDRGARVAHKLCVDFPARVRATVLLDICPTLAMYTATDFTFARAYYHWFLLIQDAPLPETLISGSPRRFLELAMGGRQGEGLAIFHPEALAYYTAVVEDPAAVHAMCNDYRAGATLDLDEQRADLAAGRLVQCPLMVLWGKHGIIEKCFDALKEWRAVAGEGVVVKGHSVESGHYIPEQRPDDVVDAVLEFCV
jgi:pimeloyl-ACP methyl ester carboxylesterase